jgi:DNA-binding response OmpR family regulator
VAKILLVDDDQTLTKMVHDWLVFEHHQVETASDGDEGLYKVLTYSYDIIVLDINMPGKDGIQICQEYRSHGGQSPVLMLTGRNKIENKEEGFNVGADDYLTKPFHMKELTVRITALLRRARTVTEKIYSWGDVKVDGISFKVTKGGAEVKLLPKEFGLLEFLMANPNRVFTPDAILDRLWASESDATSNAVITCISRIRTKLDDKGTKNSIIKTVHGVGYRFDQ